LFDDQRSPCAAKPTVQHFARSGAGGSGIARNDNTLARSKPIGLHNDVSTELVDGGIGLGHTACNRKPRGGNAILGEELFAERFRTLELRPGRARPKRQNSTRSQFVGNPCNQRRLWPNDHEVHSLAPRQLDQSRVIVD
jgi:hypothetical protein